MFKGGEPMEFITAYILPHLIDVVKLIIVEVLAFYILPKIQQIPKGKRYKAKK